MCREVLGASGHLITLVMPGGGMFGDQNVGPTSNLSAFSGVTARSVKSIFSKVKYSVVIFPIMGQVNTMQEFLSEEVTPMIDSEVDMLDEEAVREAVERVALHRNSGRVVLVNKEND